jgi:protein kinase-like protein
MNRGQARTARNRGDRAALIRDAARVRASIVERHLAGARISRNADGGVRLGLEPVEAPTLGSVMERGRVGPRSAVTMLAQLAKAVAALERSGLVARDLAPDRVLLDRARGAVLVDYGIPPQLMPLQRPEPDRNFAFRAPEETAHGPLTSRAAVYSLGALLLAALTGDPEPGPIRPRDDDDESRDLPPTLRSVIARAMAEDPESRYDDAIELAKAAVDVLRTRERLDRARATQDQSPAKPTRVIPWKGPEPAPSANGAAPTDGTLGRVLSAVTPAKAPGTHDREAAREQKAREAAEREAAKAALEQQRTAAKAAEADRKAKDAADREATRAADADRKAKEAADREAMKDAAAAERKAGMAKQAADRKAAEDAEAERKAKEAAQRKAAKEAEAAERRAAKAKQVAQRKAAKEAEAADRKAAKAKQDADRKAAKEAEAAERDAAAAARADQNRTDAAARERAREDKRASRRSRRAGGKAHGRPQRTSRRSRRAERKAHGRPASPRPTPEAPAPNRRDAAHAGATTPPARNPKGAAAAPTGTARRGLGRRKIAVGLAGLFAAVGGVVAIASLGGTSAAGATKISNGELTMRLPAGWKRTDLTRGRFGRLSSSLAATQSDGTLLLTGTLVEPKNATRAIRRLAPNGTHAVPARLGALQVSRYDGLRPRPGTAARAYVLGTTGQSVLIVCQATGDPSTGALRGCADVASSVRLEGELPLSLAAANARGPAAYRALVTLHRRFLADRSRIAGATIAAEQAAAVRDLEVRYYEGSRRIQATGLPGRSVAKLVAALYRAGEAYGALAAAIDDGDSAAYDQARAEVLAREDGLWAPAPGGAVASITDQP